MDGFILAYVMYLFALVFVWEVECVYLMINIVLPRAPGGMYSGFLISCDVFLVNTSQFLRAANLNDGTFGAVRKNVLRTVPPSRHS